MIAKIRNSVFSKVILLLLSFHLMLPLQTWAITGGPSQPEFTSFTPVGVDDMVDLFSGDFQYNIPLLDVDGYPVNLSYSSGIGMEDQASCVGLGWTLNAAGVINRTVRGLPDDFKEDEMKTVTHLKTNRTFGVNFGVNAEIVGFPLGIGLGYGIFTNNYTGPGFDVNTNVSISMGDKMKVGGTLDLGYSSESGFSISPAASLSSAVEKSISSEAGNISLGSLGGGLSYNSRSGLRSVTIGMPAKVTMAAFFKSGDYTIPTGLQTYVPQITSPINSSSVAVDLGLGGEFAWANLKGKVGGYYIRQDLASSTKTSPAYGYLYAGEGQNNNYALHDFNRENEGAFNRYVPSLPMAQMTYDIYTATGQGVGGMYRPYRDFGTVYDPYTYQSTNESSFGADVGFGGYVKLGANVAFGYTATTSGRWKGGNSNTKQKLAFQKGTKVGESYEPVFFKSAGDFSIIDNDYFENVLQGVYPIRIAADNDGTKSGFQQLKNASDFSETTVGIGNNRRPHRERRNQPFSFLTVEEAQRAALNKSIVVGDGNAGRKNHHISEVTITRPDGTRYVYGMQTYNMEQQEVSFNVEVSGNYDQTRHEGMVKYSPGVDNSSSNTKGLDQYFNCNILPPHATAYQLTAIVSADYVDVKGDGPTADDLGTYTKFNYRTHTNNYKWRNPYQQDVANFNEGYKFRRNDDKGTYIYGKKEIKILESIETKNYIATFHYSARNDAWEVKNENGGINKDGNTLPKLDAIHLYTKYEKDKEATTTGYKAKPLKSVHFRYSYELCKGIPSYYDSEKPNDKKGKLTLDTLFFTYGDSKKGMLSPYVFTYDENNNPNYKTHYQDRWGTYKSDALNPGGLSNIEAPYVYQDTAVTNKYAASWNLKTIRLPSGGEIDVKYESDDYAFVQDKRATSMVALIGLADNGNYNNISSNLYTSNNDNFYVYFKAPAKDLNDFKNQYLGGAKESLYYKFYVNLSPKAADKDYVSGYADYSEFGWRASDNVGWIKLKEVTLDPKRGNKKVNPVTKAAMQYINVNAPDLYYGGNNDNDYKDAGEAVFRKMAAIIDDMVALVDGLYDAMKRDHLCQTIEPGKSFLRLKAPNGHMLGGGSRVKELTINDNWSEMTGTSNKVESYKYGQKYDYTLTTEYAEDGIPAGTRISSGVAVYEPMVGGDENPLHNPRPYTVKHKGKVPDNEFYQERPYGESFFPSPSVGYSRIVVASKANDLVRRTSTGYTEHKFYTAKDFPVIMRFNDPYMPAPKRKSSDFLAKIFNFNVKDYMTASQSFAIELNDMHGKEKSKKVYAEGQSEAISSIEYFYKKEAPKQLSNKILSVDKNGQVESLLAGIHADLVVDEREWSSLNVGGTVAANIDISPFLFGFPLPLPSVWPGVHMEETRFRSITSTKVITRYGIMEKAVAQDLGSTITTENLAWDAETGEVLLNKTQNNFNDPVYSFTYPAHWGYSGMASAYKNIGLRWRSVDFNNVPDPQSFFKEGDEMYVIGSGISRHGWVTAVHQGAGRISVVDREGKEIQGGKTYDIQIIRSGHRNLQSTPIGSVTTLTNPIVGNQINFTNARVLNAGAVEFASYWPESFCENDVPDRSENPYVNGEEGNYRPKRSYVYLTGRSQIEENRNSNIRFDGIFSSFSPFWKPLKGFNWFIDRKGWTFASEVTMFNPNGFEIENVDALGRYTSASYGYNKMLPISVSANAQYKEAGFTGFEDAKVNVGEVSHFGFTIKAAEASFTDQESHVGKYSIQVKKNNNVELERYLVPCKE